MDAVLPVRKQNSKTKDEEKFLRKTDRDIQTQDLNAKVCLTL